MGIERYLLASSLNMVVAQRLVRKICDRCKEPVKLPDEALKQLGISAEQAGEGKISAGKGCNACGGTGYKGRLPIFEFLPVDKEIAEAIIAGQGESEIRSVIRARGYGSLRDSGVSKMLEGHTTAEEILRVTFAGKD